MTYEEARLRINHFSSLSQNGLLLYRIQEACLLDRLEAFQVPEFEFGGRDVVCQRSLERILHSLCNICENIDEGCKVTLPLLQHLFTGLVALECSQDMRLRIAPLVKPFLYFEAQAVLAFFLSAPRLSELVRLSADLPILLKAFYKREDPRERLRIITDRGKPEVLYGEHLITFRGIQIVNEQLVAQTVSQLSLELLLWEELERLT